VLARGRILGGLQQQALAAQRHYQVGILRVGKKLKKSLQKSMQKSCKKVAKKLQESCKKVAKKLLKSCKKVAKKRAKILCCRFQGKGCKWWHFYPDEGVKELEDKFR
jgi:hypothetical protein